MSNGSRSTAAWEFYSVLLALVLGVGVTRVATAQAKVTKLPPVTAIPSTSTATSTSAAPRGGATPALVMPHGAFPPTRAAEGAQAVPVISTPVAKSPYRVAFQGPALSGPIGEDIEDINDDDRRADRVHGLFQYNF